MNVTELHLQPQELDVIPVKRTSMEIIARGQPRYQITGRQYRRMLRQAWFTAGVELGVIIVLSVALYIAQAGPV